MASSKSTPIIQASASHEKQPGTLAVTKRKILWTSSSNTSGKPDITIYLPALIGLFASKPGQPNRKLRMVSDTDKPPTFTFPDEEDAERFKLHLTPIAAENKENKEKAAAASAVGSGAVTPAAGTNGTTTTAPEQEDNSLSKDNGPGSSNLRGVNAQSKRLNTNELKAAVLIRSPELAKLHANIVLTGYMTEAEFWAGREHLILAEAASESQRRGKSGLIIDPRPTRDESGKATMKLSNEMIEEIFDEFPIVRRAYDENVPSKIEDQEFWARYVQSKLASRNSASARGAASEHTVQDDDIFDKYLEKDDDGVQPRQQLAPVSERLVDLDATAQDHPQTGNNQDVTMQAGKQRQSLPLIRRFNEHSQRLLDATLGSEPPAKRRKVTFDDDDDRYLNQIVIEDLQAPASTTGIPLEMTDRQKYFEGSRGGDSAAMAIDDPETVDVPTILPNLMNSLNNWSADMTNMKLERKAAEEALTKMTTNVKSRLDVRSRRNDFPEDMLQEMTSLQTATSEFLRQFWSAVHPPPPEQGVLSVASPAQLASRAQKMAGYLAKTREKVASLVQKGRTVGMDLSKIDAAFAPTLVTVDKALQTHKTRFGR